MRKFLIVMLCCLTMLAGCSSAYENPYRVDTVVRIPVDPTEAPTEAPAEETVVPTETAPEVTEAPKKSTSTGKKSSSGTSSNKNTSQSTTKTTEPPVTEPPQTLPPTEPPFVPEEYTAGALEQEILAEINRYRAEAQLEELPVEAQLSEMAAVRSNEASRTWSHTRPDGRGFETVLDDYGYGYTSAAENLIYGSGEADAADMVAKWMESDSHRENILSEHFTALGVGLYTTHGYTYITVLFVG